MVERIVKPRGDAEKAQVPFIGHAGMHSRVRNTGEFSAQKKPFPRTAHLPRKTENYFFCRRLLA